MKYATLSKSAFAVTAILIAVACSDSEDSTEQASPTEPGEITGNKIPPREGGAPEVEKHCPASCTTNDQCASACPVPSGGVQCCSSNQCYAVAGSTCPTVKNPEGPDSGSVYPAP